MKKFKIIVSSILMCIILFVVFAFSDDKERSLQAGMNEHVSKPIEEKQLIRYIRKYMINHKASM